MTITVTNHHSNPNPRVLKIENENKLKENENREENKMQLKSIIFKPVTQLLTISLQEIIVHYYSEAE